MSADNMVRRSVQERGVVALERIADALEAANASDPLTMLSAALDGDGETLASFPEPREPFASNGQTLLYKHPDPDLVVVLRRDGQAVGGYAVAVEEA